jgi:2-keto-4-pentenoate hydratase/2-oxohepta-3-ene-1,7-dioic acid hydratase in catechol pathway
MKLLRYGDPGEEQWGMLDQDGKIRTLADVLLGLTGDELSPHWLGQLQKLDPKTLPLLNYADHAAETGGKIPKEPIVFLKSLSAFSGPYDDIKIPRGAEKTDWEVELGVVIGSKANYVTEAAAMDHVAGYVTVNDVSERSYQTERAGTWDKGKGCETFGPVGPWLVTRDEIPDPQNLDLWTFVDGKRMQHGNTSTMVYGVAMLVSYVSQFITLHPGDIIATGTPPGVGMGIKPEPIYLKPGQTLKVGVQGLGDQVYKTIPA